MKQLELADDGRVIIRNRTSEWILGRPTLGEYRTIVERAEAADRFYAAEIAAIVDGDGKADVDAQVRRAGELQLGTADSPPLYGALVCGFIEILGDGDPPDVDDLPSWAVSGRAVGRMIAHWRAVPLDLGPSGEDL